MILSIERNPFLNLIWVLILIASIICMIYMIISGIIEFESEIIKLESAINEKLKTIN